MDKLEIVQLYQKTYPQVSREIAKKGTINGVWELHFKDSFINHIKWMIKDDMVNLIKSVCFTMLTLGLIRINVRSGGKNGIADYFVLTDDSPESFWVVRTDVDYDYTEYQTLNGKVVDAFEVPFSKIKSVTFGGKKMNMTQVNITLEGDTQYPNGKNYSAYLPLPKGRNMEVFKGYAGKFVTDEQKSVLEKVYDLSIPVVEKLAELTSQPSPVEKG